MLVLRKRYPVVSHGASNGAKPDPHDPVAFGENAAGLKKEGALFILTS